MFSRKWFTWHSAQKLPTLQQSWLTGGGREGKCRPIHERIETNCLQVEFRGRQQAYFQKFYPLEREASAYGTVTCNNNGTVCRTQVHKFKKM
jgi:hypothetical protein